MSTSSLLESAPVGTVPERLEGIPPCHDSDVQTWLRKWGKENGFWAVYPDIPIPGPTDEWLELLDRIAACPYTVRFSRSLAGRLRPWIPESLWESVVKS